MMDMKTPLSGLSWDPDTCGCKFEIAEEETVQDGVTLVPYEGPTPVRNARIVVDGGALMWELPTCRTLTCDAHGRTIEAARHAVGEAPPLGKRRRGRATFKCSMHQDFDGVVQTQRVRCPDVCGCVWQELWVGAVTKDVYFGSFTERVCPEHADRISKNEIALGDVREVVQALARDLT